MMTTKFTGRAGPADAAAHPARRRQASPRILLAPLRAEEERAELRNRQDVRRAVARDVGDRELDPDARAAVDLMGDELHLGLPYQAEPVDHRFALGLDVPLGTVSPAALAGDDVGEPVAVEIGDRQRMGL